MNTTRTTISLLSATLLGLAAGSLSGQGDPGTSAPPVEKPKIEARFYSQSTPFAGDIVRGIITAETNQFSFVVPSGFRQQIDPKAKKVTFTSTNYLCEIVATLHEAAVEGRTDLKPESLRPQLTARYKEGKIVDEFNASIESMSGPAFEIEWPGEVEKMSVRAAFIPYPGGHIEVTVQSPSRIFRSYDPSLFQLLLSFRTSPIGAKLPVQEFLTEL